jgi:hypothetical protein
MSVRNRLAVVLLCAAIYGIAPGFSPRRLLAQSPAVNQPASSGAQSQQEQLDAMKADLARMRAILGQMQNNIGFVGATTTPLNHQFALEIEMWQVLITQMERRVEAMQRANPPQR